MSETTVDLTDLDEGVKAVTYASWLAGTLGRLSPFFECEPPADYKLAYEAMEAARADREDTTGHLTRKDLAAQLGIAKTSVGQRLRNAKIKPKLIVNKIGYYHPDDLGPIADREAVAA